MLKQLLLVIGIVFAAGACRGGSNSGAGASAEASSGASDRGGTVTVGDHSWTLVPATQCSVYPNDQVNISGHAAADPTFEIVIDYYPDGDGPIGLSGGPYGRMGSWRSVRETMEITIDGRQVRGTGTFTVATQQGPQTVNGSFEVSC